MNQSIPNPITPISNRLPKLDIRSISSRVAYPGIPPGFIEQVLSGEFKDIKGIDYTFYEKIYKIRHDSIHCIICHSRSLEFGEVPIGSRIILDDPQFKLVEKQSPDIFDVKGKKVTIVELTISSAKDADARKTSKYSLLIKLLEKHGYEVDFEVIVVSNIQGVPDRDVLNKVHKLDHNEINLITDILINVNKVLQLIHQTELGSKWLLQFREVIADDFVFVMTNEEIIAYHDKVSRKCFKDDADLRSILTINEPTYLTDSDKRILDMLIEHSIKTESPMEKNSELDEKEFWSFHEERANRYSHRNILPIPFLNNVGIDSSMRHIYNKDTLTDYDLIEITKLTGEFKLSGSPYWDKFSNMRSYMDKVKLSYEDKVEEAMEGPGRKGFLSKLNCPIEIQIKEKEDRKMWIDPHLDTKEIEEVSKLFSEINNKSEIKEISDLSKLDGPGLNYVRLFQSIMREITINSSRKNRNHQYILRPTGFDGVFVLIHPGPRLRTGENLSQIFYRVIYRGDIVTTHNLSSSWVFKKFIKCGSFFHTKWISIDANRLDHYIRSFDKILMAYASYMQYGPNSLIDNIKADTSNTLGMIILTYLEDRRSTSKMLQDLRYVVMMSLSMFKYWPDMVDKFKDPLRSSLQVYYLQRIIRYIKESKDMGKFLLNDCRFGKSRMDPGSMDVSDKLAGSIIILPRVLTIGPKINFQQMLCEMYFSMLFNKNQDDPTHSSHQILNKILEGDESLKKVKESTRLHIGKNNSDRDDIITLLSKPMKNQFSRRVIMIASKLQSSSEFNNSQAGSAYLLASQNKFLNKTLDEFSTFKSSSQCLRKTFDGNLYREFSTEGNDDDETEELKRYKAIHYKEQKKDEYEMQNPRRRCIEGTIDLMKKGIWKSFDLINEIKEPNIFQVFKKNQIGGVREIVILDIKKRILINIMETFSRLICKEDGREMLTHGDKKFGLFRDMLREIRRQPEKRLIVNHNYDKTKWGPSFMPIQFLYMFAPFRSKIPDLFKFILVSLINHTNKECLIPERLIQSWYADPHNLKHSDPLLQQLKEHFKETKEMSFINESNMGQGILHYTSSLFHLCVISLRDYLYYGMCSRKGISPGEIRDLVSSDDSYTAQALPMDRRDLNHLRIRFFLRAQWTSERLMNVWTSKTKSSVSLLVHEFNSLFGSNLGVFPTLFKFALSSVQPVNTDSFYRMVKESYNQSRQIVENGGSLELYLLSQNLNKIYTEQIYHTYQGGQNDFRTLNIREKNMPYHLGVFPIGDPSIMMMIGPEYHNYDIFSRMYPKADDGSRHKKTKDFTEEEIKIWNTSHSMVDLNPDVLASLNSQDNLFIGLTRIEANVGPIKKILVIRRQMDLSWDDIQKFIMKNPMSLFRKPESIEECKLKTYLKMYQNGVSEALRTTAASIYYARVAATVSANCFYIPFVTRKVAHSMERRDDGTEIYYDENNEILDAEELRKNKTYMDCIKNMVDLGGKEIDVNAFYAYIDEYETMKLMIKPNIKYRQRSRYETQNIRTLTLSKVTQQILNPIPNLLYKFWFRRLVDDVPFENSELRDWVTLKEMTGLIEDTMEDTILKFNGSDMDRLRQLIMVILRLMSHHNSPMKAVIFGPSSKSYDTTYQILNNLNAFHTLTNENLQKIENVEVNSSYYNDLFLIYNYFVLSQYSECTVRVKDWIDINVVNQVFRDPGVSPSVKRRILMLCIHSGVLGDLGEWSDRTRTILHNWEVRQNRNPDGSWSGPFRIRLQQGATRMVVESSDGKMSKIITNTFKEPKILEELIRKSAELLALSTDEFVKTLQSGYYKITTQGVKNIRIHDGFKILRVNLAPLSFTPGKLEFENNMMNLYDVFQKKIMSTTVGLISCEGATKIPFKNFKVEGSMFFLDLLKMNIFSQSFSVEYLSEQRCVDLLDDLEVSRPKLTKGTIERLGLKGYDTRDPDEYDQLLLESVGFKETLEEQKKRVHDEKQSKLLDHPEPSLIDMIMEEWDTDQEKKLLQHMTHNDDDFNDKIMDVNLDFSIITAHQELTISRPVALFNLALHIKELLISRCVTDVSYLCRKTLNSSLKLTGNMNIYHSLLFLYDKVFQQTDIQSPSGLKLQISEIFSHKFGIQI